MRTNEYGFTLDYANQCAAWKLNNQGPARSQCALPPIKNIGEWIYLCNRHYLLIEREIEGSIDSLNSRRVENLQERLDAAEAAAADAELAMIQRRVAREFAEYDKVRRAQTVYFIRCQQYVKIGISKNPHARLEQIRNGGGAKFPRLLDVGASEIAATEPGGLVREKELHAKFAHLRHTGEWFTEAPELTDYIRNIERSAA